MVWLKVDSVNYENGNLDSSNNMFFDVFTTIVKDNYKVPNVTFANNHSVKDDHVSIVEKIADVAILGLETEIYISLDMWVLDADVAKEGYLQVDANENAFKTKEKVVDTTSEVDDNEIVD